jgi:hypothetical protein
MKEKKDIIDTAENRNRLKSALFDHVGEVNAISMTALYEIVFERHWNDKINDTRALRHLITALREDGVPICSTSSQHGGYYIAAAGSEFIDFLRKTERRAICILMRNARMKKVSLPEYLGQLKLDMENNNEAA